MPTTEAIPASRPQKPELAATSLGIASWCLFDWANQGLATVIETFVFSPYFTQAVAPSPIEGTSQWGFTVSIAGICVAVLAPICGAIADEGGRRKPWLLAFSAAAIIAITMLWFVKPSPDWTLWALTFLALSVSTGELGFVFYNAMLPTMVPRRMLGRVSGRGWATGYAGGLACLAVVFLGFVGRDDPWFGLDPDQAEHVRVSALVVALWWIVFAVPLFLFTPDRTKVDVSFARATRAGLRKLADRIRNLHRHANIVRFLVARLIYNDGLNTLFSFGGIYAAGTFGMDTSEVLVFGIALTIAAGGGAFALSWVDDWIGGKRTVLLSLGSLIVLGMVIVLAESTIVFWIAALALAIFIGPVQAASRSLMARLSPVGQETEMFGLYALSGKAIAFMGPAVLAGTTSLFESQRAGMATILIFFVIGFLILLTVREPEE